MSNFILLGCKSEARAIAHALKTSCIDNILWFNPRSYSAYERSLDLAFSSNYKIPLASDFSHLENLIAHEYSDAIILLANFRKIDTSILPCNMMCINFHNSKLPDYKGIHPIHWQIRDGSAYIWLSVHLATDQIDSGPLLLRTKVKRNHYDDAASISVKLAGETYRLARIIVRLLREQSPIFRSALGRNSPYPFTSKLKRPWARRLTQVDNFYCPDNANSLADFIDSTPYPFNISQLDARTS